MGWLDKLMGKTDQAAAPDAAQGEPLPVSMKDGIYHEFFVSDEPEKGRYGWLGRVYARGGVMHQTSGSEETNEAAAQAAIAWAEAKKDELRREA